MCVTTKNAFLKNAAQAFPFSHVYEEHGSTPSLIVAFTKRGYRPPLRPRFPKLRLRLAP